MAQNLFEHGRITTTLPKAKSLRPFVEKLITLAVSTRRHAARHDSVRALSARRRIHALLTDRCIIPKESKSAYEQMSDAARAKSLRSASGRRYRTGESKGRLAFTADSVVRRLIENIAPRFEGRPGGYTRIIRLPSWRIGDGATLAMISLLGGEEAPTSLTKPARSARKRRTDARFSLAIKLSKGFGRKQGATASAASGESDATSAESGGAS